MTNLQMTNSAKFTRYLTGRTIVDTGRNLVTVQKLTFWQKLVALWNWSI